MSATPLLLALPASRPRPPFAAQSYKARSEARPTNDSIGLSNTATDMELPSMPLPGEDYRWLLPDDYSGLQGLAGLYSHLNDMDHLRTLYFFLQVRPAPGPCAAAGPPLSHPHFYSQAAGTPAGRLLNCRDCRLDDWHASPSPPIINSNCSCSCPSLPRLLIHRPWCCSC